jgi:hypothetical protein
MLAAGVHPNVASERLGHSKVGITLSRVDDALRAALQKRQSID